jgi:enamine deaminase RidA (YjgF/YER057c/UK114 family)
MVAPERRDEIQEAGEGRMSAEDNLKKLGLTLPNIPTPVANYVPWKRDGNTIYLSGQGPRDKDGKHITGTVGKDVTVDQAYQYAQLVGLNLLAAAKAAAGGSLDKVEVLKVLGMVNAVPGFGDQPKVINGCSDLFVNVLGERGRHARSAVGMGSLPVGIPVEIEAVMRVVD